MVSLINGVRHFLAPSDIDSDHPFKVGFSFDNLTNSMLASNSLSVVTVLDSCYSGSLKLSKGGSDSKSGEDAATSIANKDIEEKSDKLSGGIGRCLLAASQGYEEAYDRKEKDHSVFTYYLLEGLKGDINSVDAEGNVTPYSLGMYIHKAILNLPLAKRPKQRPITKTDSSGEIILASYPRLKKTNESDIYIFYGKGENYYRLGQYQQALDSYDSVLEIQPHHEFSLLRKGEILVLMNEFTKAMQYFNQLIELNNKSQLHLRKGEYEMP